MRSLRLGEVLELFISHSKKIRTLCLCIPLPRVTRFNHYGIPDSIDGCEIKNACITVPSTYELLLFQTLFSQGYPGDLSVPWLQGYNLGQQKPGQAPRQKQARGFLGRWPSLHIL